MTTVVVIPVATLVIATWACGTSFSDGSVIVPDRVPPATCALVGTESRVAKIKDMVTIRPNE